MKVHFIRSGERRYSMRIERDGLPVLVMDPAPGFDPDLPHDMVHFVVEAALGLKTGVFGQIGAGGDAGSFHVEAGGALSAKDRQRAARKQVARGAKLVKAQGREGELSELAAFLFDVAWRSSRRPDGPAQRAALAEAGRIRASLSAGERAGSMRRSRGFSRISNGCQRHGARSRSAMRSSSTGRRVNPSGKGCRGLPCRSP